MHYILVTYDAVSLFATDRFFQSVEFQQSEDLCALLKGETDKWDHNSIFCKKSDAGLIFFSKSIDKKQGVLFDLDTFSGFELSNDKVINIFQRVIKYTVRYINNAPLTASEKVLPGKDFTMIFPFPFVATKDVDKVLVDRNSSKISREGRNFLTVFHFGHDEKAVVSFTNLRKALDELSLISAIEYVRDKEDSIMKEKTKKGLSVTDLDNTDLSIDSSIGLDNWFRFLTEKQRSFVSSAISGPERLEGAAGTGKTLALVLRCIYHLQKCIENKQESHLVFVTHSIPTKDRIISIFQNNWADFSAHQETDENRPFISICVTTLQEWSAMHLGTSRITDNEFLDKDASESKYYQTLYVEQSFDHVIEKNSRTYEVLCSPEFWKFITDSPKEYVIDMIQKEIAEIIKGRASEDYEVYKTLDRPLYSLPVKNDADLNFLFNVYEEYQNALNKVGQYDSDDIVLTALGHINTPIWKRRRVKDGYDACIIDETHLFNLNELSIFHFINKPDCKNNIVFAIDKSQAFGDWGINKSLVTSTLNVDKESSTSETHFATVFRSSPDIVNLAFNILSSGATLFTNFENPLNYSMFNFTHEDERKSRIPTYYLENSDQQIIVKGFNLAEEYYRCTESSKSDILIVSTSDSLLVDLEKYGKKHNKAYAVLKSRNDSKTMRSAKDNNKYLLSSIEFVGGLEFDCVILLGVDEGRVPPSDASRDSFHYMNYMWHNKMYVAVTRAKYALYCIGLKTRGISPILDSAVATGILRMGD